MKLKSLIIACILMIAFVSQFSVAEEPAAATTDDSPSTNEADELDKIVLHSFEHFDYLDILYKLKGHNNDTWVVLFYISEDHHKEQRDRLKKLIFKDNPTFKYAEANISKPNYSPIKKVIKFPANAGEKDFPMILVMKQQVGQMVYGPGVARKAADVLVAMKEKEEADAKAKEEADAKAAEEAASTT